MLALRRILAVTLLVVTPGVVHAYIGPGVGLSAIGSVISLIVAAFLLVVGFLWYPFKRLLRKKKKDSADEMRADNQVDKES